MGVLPNSQFGDVAVLNLGEGGSIPVGLGSGSEFYALANSNKIPTASLLLLLSLLCSLVLKLL